MWVLMLSLSISPSPQGPVTSVKLKQDTIQMFSLANGSCVVFFDLTKQQKPTFDLWVNSSNRSFTRTNCVDRFLFLSGLCFAIRPSTPLTILIWRIPVSFCAKTVYAISADGELFGALERPRTSGPLCLFSHPFATNYQMSSLIGERRLAGNLTVTYYVGSLSRAFSTCEIGTECLFMHTQPFLLKIEWKNGTQFNINLKFQTGSMKHSDQPCFLGPIPQLDGEVLPNPEKFNFECQDQEEQQYREFITVLLTVLGFLVLAIALHATGFVNMKVAFGCENESIRFEKIRQDLQLVRSSWPPFTDEDDQGL
jgi:hypothetical protein